MNATANVFLQSVMFLVQNVSRYNVSDTIACYGVYGCYSTEYPWKTDTRPVSYFPLPPESFNVRYPTFTRRNVKIPYILDPNEPDKIRRRNFNSDGPFFVIAHGYLEGGDKPWIQEMTEALLSLKQNANATVIALDWREASGPPYSQAVANIRLLGMITAHVIHDMFVQLKLKNLDKFHFIGHSLGAHLGGYTGNALKEKFNLILGRITGLDPAEPLFSKVENIVRLDRTDAKFVDVIHTDASPFISGGLGLAESIGHVDFFPNGGASQPGCSQGMMQYINSEKEGSLVRGIRKYLGCNHLRSYEYFIESIVTSCPFLSITCKSYKDFTRGTCFQCGINNQFCMRFGYYSNIGYRRLIESSVIKEDESIPSYFMTGDMPPFCRVHYRVTVNMSSSLESSSHGGDIGRLWMVLINKNGTVSERIPLEEHAGPHKPGTQKTIIVPSKDIGVIESANIEWEYETNLLNPFTWRLIMAPRVYIAWVYIESLEYRTSIAVCPLRESPVTANTPTLFQQKNCKDLLPVKISTIGIANKIDSTSNTL